MLVSVVVPVFNEEDMIGLFLDAMSPVLKGVRRQLGADGQAEIVFVDDGSHDRTVDHILDAQADGFCVRLVKLSRNFGKDAALAAGLAHAKGDAVVPMDVDLQDPPEVLPRMIESWLDGAKVVNAVRTDRVKDGWLKRSTAQLFYRIYNRLASYPIEPNVGDYRLLDREVVDNLNLMPERIRFMKGLFSWVGYTPARIEYHRESRAAGQTKWKLWSLWNFALDGITGSTTLPLRIWTYFGVSLAFVALSFATFIVVRAMVFGVDVPGYASLMVVTLTLGAVNLTAVGIVGEYVGRIAIEVKQRPLYLVEKLVEKAARSIKAGSSTT